MDNKPVCYEPERELPEIYSGVPTFLGLPKITDSKQLEGFDIAIMGAPWEGIVTWGGHSGCELAPKTIREASVRYGGYLPEFDRDAFDYFRGGDYGDAPVHNGHYQKSLELIGDKFEEIIGANTFPITFGGDHSITYPLLQKLVDKYEGKVGLIHLDSHLDNLNDFGGEEYARCSPFHRVYEIEGFDPEKLVHMGIRGPRNKAEGIKTAREYGAGVISSFDIKKQGIERSLEQALEIVKDGTEAVYVSVCSDILDVAFNPGGPPDMCGLSTGELARLLYGIAARGIEGFDFVEIYPPGDTNNVSSHAAAWMTVYLLNGLSAHHYDLEPKQL